MVVGPIAVKLRTASYNKLSRNMIGENFETLLQNPVLKACIRRKASEKTALILCSNLLKEGSHTPLYIRVFICIVNRLIFIPLQMLA